VTFPKILLNLKYSAPQPLRIMPMFMVFLTRLITEKRACNDIKPPDIPYISSFSHFYSSSEITCLQQLQWQQLELLLPPPLSWPFVRQPTVLHRNFANDVLPAAGVPAEKLFVCPFDEQSPDHAACISNSNKCLPLIQLPEHTLLLSYLLQLNSIT